MSIVDQVWVSQQPVRKRAEMLAVRAASEVLKQEWLERQILIKVQFDGIDGTIFDQDMEQCRNCTNWEKRQDSGMGDGYCSLFDKFTDPDHGKKCTGFA